VNRRPLSTALALMLGAVLFHSYTAVNAGEPDLMQTLIAEDATLNDNVMPMGIYWEKNGHSRDTGYSFGVEKQLSERFGIELEGQWDEFSPRAGRDASGFGDIDVLLKYVFLSLPETGFMFALEGGVSLSPDSHIGTEKIYAESTVAVAWGGRLRKLEATGWTRYLRAFEFQGDLGYSRLFDRAGSAAIFMDPVLDYSIPYLNYENAGLVPRYLQNFCPFVELNLERTVGERQAGPAALFLTPGLAVMGDTYQVSAGAQIAMNHQAAGEKQVAVTASLLIFLDQIDSRFGWRPF
jgi:hypothetical protein